MPADDFRFERISATAPCLCRSGHPFGNCHGAPICPSPETPPPPEFVSEISARQGTTPDWLKQIVEAAIKYLFTPSKSRIAFSQPRGESCATVAMQTQRLLREFGVAARVVVGAAGWRGYPLRYAWAGPDEYHAWVETEFGEIVDMTCDDLNHRTNLPLTWTIIPAPANCWDLPSALTDRGYVEIEGGHAQINVDVPGELGFDTLAELLLTFCNDHKAEFQQRYPTP